MGILRLLSTEVCSRTRFHERALEVLEDWHQDEYKFVENIAEARCGEVILVEHTPSREQFAVKRMPRCWSRPNVGSTFDETSPDFLYEDPLSEIGIMAHLIDVGVVGVLPESCRFCTDEHHDYIIMKHHLGGDLFNALCRYGRPLSETTMRLRMQQLLESVRRLHAVNVAHRDISLENILVDDDDGIKLIDFSQAVPIRSEDPGAPDLRYFVRAGKDPYRAPEVFVPDCGRSLILVECPADSKAGDAASVLYQGVRVEVALAEDAKPGEWSGARPCGYCAAPTDVFACGACLFAMAFLDHGVRPQIEIAEHVRQCDQVVRLGMSLSAAARELLSALLNPDPASRITAEVALQHPWFTCCPDISSGNDACRQSRS